MNHEERYGRMIQSAFDGSASDEELLALRAAMKADPAVLHRYFEFARLHNALTYRYSRKTGQDTAQMLVTARLRTQTRRSAAIAMTAAAALLVLTPILLHMVLLPQPEPMALIEQARGTIVTIAHTDPDAEMQAGELAKDSVVTLSQGSLELRLRNGSRAVILAPAAFSLRSERGLHLNHGTAWFHITEEDRGFEVTTPELHVTDLGTEFGVITSRDGDDEVHVFKGRVIARSRNPLRHEETLTADESRRSDPAGRLKTLASRPEAFLVRLPDAATDRLIANGDFESGMLQPDLGYGRPATPAMLPGWRFGSETMVVKAATEGRWGSQGSISNRHPLRFGGDPTMPRLFLNGLLDDVAVWKGALSQSEVDALWNGSAGRAAADVASSAALISNWTFDSGLDDAVGSREAESFGDARVQTGAGKIGAGAAAFDGQGDYLTAGSKADFAIGNGTLSVSFWFKVNDATNAKSTRFLSTGAGWDHHTGWSFLIDDNSPGGDLIGAAMGDGIGRTVQKSNANGSVDPFDGEWRLVVAVFDASTGSVNTYLDGVRETAMAPDLPGGGAVGVNVFTLLSSTADAQVGFKTGTQSSPDPQEASIRQSFRTEPGRDYEVEFEMGGVFFRDAGVEITASAHDGVGSRDEALARHVERRSRDSGTGYNPPARFQFTAASGTTTLVFTETSADSEYADPVLDNVVVRALGGE